jgi:hypothetical protein
VHGVEAETLLVTIDRAHFDAARLAEIDIPGQFADDQDVEPGYHFRFERRSIGQFGIKDRRAQIGKQAKLLANAEQTTLGTLRAWQVVPLRTPDGTEQDRVGGLGEALRGLRVRLTGSIDRAAAEQRFFQLTAQVERLQHAHRFGHDFRADTVAGKNADLHFRSLRQTTRAARCAAVLQRP